jgi:hypothetical protein
MPRMEREGTIMADAIRAGGCACGALRYEARGEPIFVNHCYCRLCQRQTGSVGVLNAFFESDRVTVIQGELTEHRLKAGSGGEHIIARCAACGTAVFSYYPRVGRLGAGIRVGSFDDPDSFTPTAVVFTESKLPWVALPEGIPAFEQYYIPFELLSEASVGRLKALVEKKGAAD